MSVISDSFSSLGISFKDEDEVIKKNFIDCLGETCEEEEEIFDDFYDTPDEVKKYSEMKFLCIESFLNLEKTEDIFLLLTKLFPETYMFQADDWDKDYEDSDDDWDDNDDDDDDDWDDEDESGEVFGEKGLTFFNPNDMTKNQYTLSFHEVLDASGGSNGADIDFKNDVEVVKETIKKENLSISFVEEVLGRAIEKGYQDIVDMIKNRCRE